MKKILQCFALVMLLFYADSYDVAEAYYECSANETQCADAKLTYGGVDRVFSKKVFLNKGEKIAYSWENDSPGIFHVAFYIVLGNEKVSDTLYAVHLGENGGTITAKTSGYYALHALCKGGEDNRCQGGGRISRF